ncbi:hypothetical protein [Chelativorans salis]|uniref:DUF1611 domain-containing protein n=1 Tax=Chelativorans salis TaxID=2978478 RepID=A0ABT2LVF7_9HYPH|nr:hypothetical protein [Chelativorans sp. EGI FJ00035]MCT7377847.1 hypothetical protein [Chelativorans sp. EGI FJ00035]
MEFLDCKRITKAKRAFTTRRVPTKHMQILVPPPAEPRSGDLVLARIDTLGHHKAIELPSGRKAALAPGDEVLLAYGNRYAPDQFEALVPSDLGPCDMVAAGGVASRAAGWHDRIALPTGIVPIGLVADVDGQVVNIADFAIAPEPTLRLPPAIMVFGTSMNAGKTTTAASLVRGLARAGFSVGAAKVTGTGAGNDLWAMSDAGACAALDFTDAGFVTTYLTPVDAIIRGAERLLRSLAGSGADVAVLEVADGLFQPETAALAKSLEFRKLARGALFAAGDAMGAAAGCERLRSLGYDVLGMSGRLTRSPLACREASIANVPVYGIEELSDPTIAASMVPESPMISPVKVMGGAVCAHQVS